MVEWMFRLQSFPSPVKASFPQRPKQRLLAFVENHVGGVRIFLPPFTSLKPSSIVLPTCYSGSSWSWTQAIFHAPQLSDFFHMLIFIQKHLLTWHWDYVPVISQMIRLRSRERQPKMILIRGFWQYSERWTKMITRELGLKGTDLQFLVKDLQYRSCCWSAICENCCSSVNLRCYLETLFMLNSTWWWSFFKVVKPSLWLYFFFVCWVWTFAVIMSCFTKKDVNFVSCHILWVTVAPHNGEDIVTQGVVPYK